MTVRWSMTSFMGTERTEVAVGTVSDDSMFLAVRIGAPRRTVYFGCAAVGSGRSAGLGALADSVDPEPGLAGRSPPLGRRSTMDFCAGRAGAASPSAAGWSLGSPSPFAASTGLALCCGGAGVTAGSASDGCSAA